jgi:hypothetical protein
MNMTPPTETTVSTVVAWIVALIGAYTSLTATQEQAIVQGFVLVILAIIGYFQTRTATAKVAAYTPGTVESQTPSIIATLPPASYKMSEETRRLVLGQITDPAVIASINDQISKAEAANLADYTISYPTGYYHISYGLWMGATPKDDRFVSEVVDSGRTK